MIRVSQRSLRFAIVGAMLALSIIAFTTDCAKAPPTVTTPQGIVAFQNLQVQKALDQVRDIAVDANATTPPVLSTDTTRKVVTWHKAAITTLHARTNGWQAALLTGLDELTKGLPAKDQQVLAPYIELVKVILQGVIR